MSRLTCKYDGDNALRELCTFDRESDIEADGCMTCDEYCDAVEAFNGTCSDCAIQKAFDKLAEYEELEEKGLLLKLPFDVNSEVFIVSKQFTLERNCTEYVVKKLKVRDFNYNFLHNFTIVCEERIGDSICQRHLFNTDKIFLTKEEAEKELERLNNEKN